MLAVSGFFSRSGLGSFGFRWLHILAGITWIGLLYYFNLVQVPAFAEYGDEARARNIALDKVARRALWWFRWAAISTFVLGILITLITEDYYANDFGKQAGGIGIMTGMLLGTIMMLNVWGVIWPNQKIVLANAANLVAGGEANPAAAAAGRKAFMASRQNTVFSVTMLFFMVFKFAMVVLWFMHLRFDSRIFRRLFVTGIFLAIGVYLIVLLTFGVFTRS